MSFNFGQYIGKIGEGEEEKFLQDIKCKPGYTPTEGALDKTTYFIDNYVQFVDSSGNQLELPYLDSTYGNQISYYLRVKIYKYQHTMTINGEKTTSNLNQKITISLYTEDRETDVSQNIGNVEVEGGSTSDYIIKDFVFSPINTFERINFKLTRTESDYEIADDAMGYSGRMMHIEILRLQCIHNIINDIASVSTMKQIGVQGNTGLLMNIDGESIRVGKEGIYEIKSGYLVENIGFLVEPAGLTKTIEWFNGRTIGEKTETTDESRLANFILDYQY